MCFDSCSPAERIIPGEKSLKKYLAPDLLIINDFGLDPSCPEKPESICLVASRHLIFRGIERKRISSRMM
jgi:hypothetical protein